MDEYKIIYKKTSNVCNCAKCIIWKYINYKMNRTEVLWNILSCKSNKLRTEGYQQKYELQFCMNHHRETTWQEMIQCMGCYYNAVNFLQNTSPQNTPHSSSVSARYGVFCGFKLICILSQSLKWCNQYHITVRCRYNAVNFLTNIHKIHPMARPLGRGMGCILSIQHLVDILPQFFSLSM